MKLYIRDKSPDPADWLDTDESERIDLVSSYHRRVRVRLPDLRVHATIHVIVENQVAMRERAVVETLSRLQGEGLNRHDAIHAIGSVMVEHMNELLNEGHGQSRSTLTRHIFRRCGNSRRLVGATPANIALRPTATAQD